MADFGDYVGYFKNSNEDWPHEHGLWIGNNCLMNAKLGDRLWLFTSGSNCRQHGCVAEAGTQFEHNLGYLMEVFVVKELTPERNEGTTKTFEVKAIPQKALKVAPPLLIDHIVRPNENKAVN